MQVSFFFCLIHYYKWNWYLSHWMTLCMVSRFHLLPLNCLKYINTSDTVQNMNMNKLFIVTEIFLRKNIYASLRKLSHLVASIYTYTCSLSLTLQELIHTQTESLYKCCVEQKSTCLAKKYKQIENSNCKYTIVFLWNTPLIYGVAGKLVLTLKKLHACQIG